MKWAECPRCSCEGTLRNGPCAAVVVGKVRAEADREIRRLRGTEVLYNGVPRPARQAKLARAATSPAGRGFIWAIRNPAIAAAPAALGVSQALPQVTNKYGLPRHGACTR